MLDAQRVRHVISALGVAIAAATLLVTCASAVALSPPPPEPYVVLFAFNSARVDAAGHSVIDQAVHDLRTYGVPRYYKIYVTGHADSAGPADFNIALSMRRAEAVRDAM